MNPRLALLILPAVLLSSAVSAADIPSAEWQIKTAVLAAPKAERDAATVLGYDASGAVITLRKGSNKLICLADDPKQKGFNVSCYYHDLEPFMARGRELQAQGKKAAEITKIREEEVKAGKLKMPDRSVLNVTTGQVNEATGEVTELYTRYVVYIPYATPETTGIPLAPLSPGGPWIMDPGTHRAHIMINPPKPGAAEAKKK
ncbi:MAG: hypothetical protein Q8N18_18645 [Opitutaceae bacterium]|nr:hypothetical protein [Opitutaceae bacterium]